LAEAKGNCKDCRTRNGLFGTRETESRHAPSSHFRRQGSFTQNRDRQFEVSQGQTSPPAKSADAHGLLPPWRPGRVRAPAMAKHNVGESNGLRGMSLAERGHGDRLSFPLAPTRLINAARRQGERKVFVRGQCQWSVVGMGAGVGCARSDYPSRWAAGYWARPNLTGLASRALTYFSGSLLKSLTQSPQQM
jgi:hypothetical protein